MKKLIILVTFVFVTASFTMAQAEVREGSFSFGLSAGEYFFENNQDYKDNVALGLRAGYNFTENIGSEVFGYYIPSEFEDRGGSDNKVYFAGIEGLYHFMPRNTIVPFIAFGLGAIHYSSGDTELVPSKFAVEYGAGIKYFVTEGLSLRADVRHVLPWGDKEDYGDNPHTIHNDLLATLGISYDFGGRKKEVAEAIINESPAPAPAPVPAEVIADLDKDGVPDNIDKCIDTPYGISVDKDGCSVDSDFDGVPDSLDKCPQIARGLTGDKDGCPAQSAPPSVVAPVVEEKKIVTKKVSMTIDVKFDTAKALIKKKYHDEIKKVADVMNAHPEAKAFIEGHTDNVDIHHEPERNMRLSQARADSVRKYLIDEFGIHADRISAVGYGPSKPVASNDTEEGRNKNRRVQAIIEGILVK